MIFFILFDNLNNLNCIVTKIDQRSEHMLCVYVCLFLFLACFHSSVRPVLFYSPNFFSHSHVHSVIHSVSLSLSLSASELQLIDSFLVCHWVPACLYTFVYVSNITLFINLFIVATAAAAAVVVAVDAIVVVTICLGFEVLFFSLQNPGNLCHIWTL